MSVYELEYNPVVTLDIPQANTVYGTTITQRSIAVQVIALNLAVDRTWANAGETVIFSGNLSADGVGWGGETVDIFVQIISGVPPIPMRYLIGQAVTDTNGIFSVSITLPWHIAAGLQVAGYSREYYAAHGPSDTWSGALVFPVALPTRISGFSAPNMVTPGEAFTISGFLEYDSGLVDGWLPVEGRTIEIYYDATLLGTAITATDGSFALSGNIPVSGTYTLGGEFTGEDLP